MSDADVQRARRVLRRHGLPEFGGIRLTSVGDHGVEVHVEVNGTWRLAISEHHDCTGCAISHIVETDGEKPLHWPVVFLSTPPAETGPPLPGYTDMQRLMQFRETPLQRHRRRERELAFLATLET